MSGAGLTRRDRKIVTIEGVVRDPIGRVVENAWVDNDSRHHSGLTVAFNSCDPVPASVLPIQVR